MEMPSANYPGSRVVTGQLFRGYAAALTRFESASREQDPDPGFFALFESLNWAVALDDHVREVWRPNGKKLDWQWRAFAGGTELQDLLNGVRYARNLVHHHWADALFKDDGGARFPMRFPVVFFTWAWRAADDLPAHPDGKKPHVIRNRDAYERRLAGIRAEDTLLELGAAFDNVRQFVDPPRPTRG
jgi:hypothetical protein